MPRKRDIERRIDDLEGDGDGDTAPAPAAMTTEEVCEAYRAAVDPERSTPHDARTLYTETIDRKYENENGRVREGDS